MNQKQKKVIQKSNNFALFCIYNVFWTQKNCATIFDGAGY